MFVYGKHFMSEIKIKTKTIIRDKFAFNAVNDKSLSLDGVLSLAV